MQAPTALRRYCRPLNRDEARLRLENRPDLCQRRVIQRRLFEHRERSPRCPVPRSGWSWVIHDTHRFYLCQRCRDQVQVCSCCDRYRIYCPVCSPLARREAKRRAALSYQRTPIGRRNHARRQRRCRIRARSGVTRHPSPACPPPAIVAVAVGLTVPAWTPLWDGLAGLWAVTLCLRLLAERVCVRCAFCRHWCRPWARRRFLQHRTGRHLARPP